MPKRGRQSERARKSRRKGLMRESRNVASEGQVNDTVTGQGEPAHLMGKSLNALRLASPQGSLPTHEKGIPAWSDSLASDCTPACVPSPMCDAGQTKLADSLHVCTPHCVPSPKCDAARWNTTKDAMIIEKENDTIANTEILSNKKDLKQQNLEDLTVLQANYHQGDIIYGNNAGKQCVANALVSLAFVNLKTPDAWTVGDMDEILNHGNELYSFLTNHCHLHYEYLLVSDLPSSLSIYDVGFKFYFTHPHVGLLRTSSSEDLKAECQNSLNMTLFTSLKTAIQTCKCCLITFAGNTCSCFIHNDKLYVFDSHARNADGVAHYSGKATRFTFDCVEDVVHHSYALAKSVGVLSDEQFEVTGVRVHRMIEDENAMLNQQINHSYNSSQQSEEGDVFILNIMTNEHQFDPLNASDKQIICSKLKSLSSFPDHDLTHNPLIETLCQLGDNIATVHKTVPDGNCFFRAISFALFSTEMHHDVLRKITCNYILRNDWLFKSYTHSPYNSAEQYIKDSKMQSDGSWATAMEIVALCYIMESNIYTFTCGKWLKYSCESCQNARGIFLNHRANNHYDVVLQWNSSSFSDKSLNSQNDEPIGKSVKDCVGEVKDKSDELLNRYFDHQWQALLSKNVNKGNQHDKRKLYMKNYMQSKRSVSSDRKNKSIQDQDRKEKAGIIIPKQQNESSTKRFAQANTFRILERKQQQQYKNRVRQDENVQNKERKQQQLYRKRMRQDENIQSKERKEQQQYRRRIRIVENVQNKERKQQQQYRKRVREDIIIQNKERKEQQQYRKKMRQDENVQIKERKEQQRYRKRVRQDENIQMKEKKQQQQYRKIVRTDENIRKKERKQQQQYRKIVRTDENIQQKERKQQQQYRKLIRTDENIQKKERRQQQQYRNRERKKENLRNMEREQQQKYRKTIRQNKHFKSKEKLKEKLLKLKARQNTKYRCHERIRETILKRKWRASYTSERVDKEKQCDAKRKRLKRTSSDFREHERLTKQSKRIKKVSMSEPIPSHDKDRKAEKRKLKDYSKQESEITKKRKYGQTLDSCIEKFHEKIRIGPQYICTSCQQTWFNHSVTRCQSLREKCKAQTNQLYLTSMVSVDDIEWICNTCRLSILDGKVPKLSVANKMSFPHRPPELFLHQLEERLVSLRIPFMQIRELPRGGQLSIRGNVVNVPVDIQPTVNALPRPLDHNVTVSVKLKKKLSYKSFDAKENVRPVHVIAALHWLMRNSDLYKDSGIEIDEEWITSITRNSEAIVSEYIENEESKQSLKRSESLSDGQLYAEGNLHVNSDSRKGNNESITDPDENFIEVEEQDMHSAQSDTLIDEANIAQDYMYTFAPGEGQIPLSLYNDPDAEYLAFPSIFCGQRRTDNKNRSVKVHYSDIVKWELRNIDRRVAQNVPNIFFKLKKIQMKQISDKVNLVLRRCKTEGKKITVQDVLDPKKADRIARLDEGYYIFRTLRNSPPYLEAKKKDLFAMIRQIGLPTWFASLSAADTKWGDLLSMLSNLNNGKKLSEGDIENLSWIEKTQLIQKDPVTCVRYFHQRVQDFLHMVLKSNHNPIGCVKDYFYRVEFQHRGSPHVHMLLWIDNAPQYGTSPTSDITKFVDDHISCSLDISSEKTEFAQLQIHKHSKSCKKKGKCICRFGFPVPPMQETVILEPLGEDEDVPRFKKLFGEIQNYLNTIRNDNTFKSFDTFLQDLKLTTEEYHKAIRSSLEGPKVFLRRTPNESRVNPYMKNLLTAWKANHDLQFVLDPFACVVYIVNYISKGQRGMSSLLDEACKEARNGNNDLKQQVRHIGNKFLNCVEVSAQEAVYLNLQLPLTKSTRDCIFINTAPPDERTFLLKQKEDLEKLPKESTDIEADNIINRYSRRPKILNNWCLADYAAELVIVFPNKGKNGVEWDLDDDDDYDRIPEVDDSDSSINITLKNGIQIRQRLAARILRYIRYSFKIDKENYYREKILLFHPWRNENEDIRGGYQSYEEHFMVIKRMLHTKMRKYEKMDPEVIDKALEMIDPIDDDRYCELAPCNEQIEQDDAIIGSTESQSFVVFNPERPRNQREYDIGSDMGMQSKDCSADMTLQRMPTEQYYKSVRSLNRKQKEFYLHILQWVKLKEVPLNVFLTGGAGVGKSLVVKVLFEGLSRQFDTDVGQNPDLCRVLLCAPTGKAAYNIGGITIHSAFGIPASQGYSCKPLTNDKLNTMRTRYSHLRLVIIDEVSMVGNMMFNLINERLQQIKGNKQFFGGVHMILIGDLYQLKPVMDGWIFEDLKKNFGPLATNLWCDLIQMHELNEIMRQKDDLDFAHLLNRLREGKHMPEDICQLKKRQTMPCTSSYPEEATHLFTTNNSVDMFNHKVFNICKQEKCTIESMDCFLNGNQALNSKLQNLPKDSSKTAGLAHTIHISVGLKYEITANLSVADGITNGSCCTAMLIDRRQQGTTRPSIVWVLFDKEDVGVEWRQRYKHLYMEGIDKMWTPIFDVKRMFQYLKHNVVRVQFPLRLSAAKTVHKSQGDTLDQVVVDLTSSYKVPHIHYVALSRVRKMTGLHILSLNEEKMAVSDKVKEEMNRLRDHKVLQLCYKPVYTFSPDTFKFGFVNIRSLRHKVLDITTDMNISSCQLIAVAETWLQERDSNDLIAIPSYSIIRQDHRRQDTQQHRGLLAYCHNTIHVSVESGYSSTDFEFLALKVNFKEEIIQVILLYRGNTCNKVAFKQHLNEKVKAVVNQNQNLIIVGDLNYDLSHGKNKDIETMFMDMFHCTQVVNKPSHDTGSLLDHIYTNIGIIHSDVIETVFTDHNFVYAVMSLN